MLPLSSALYFLVLLFGNYFFSAGMFCFCVWKDVM